MSKLQSLFFAIGVLAAQVVNLVGGKAEDLVDNFVQGIRSQEGKTVKPLDLVGSSFDVAKAAADAIGNEKVTKLIGDLEETADDLIEGRLLEVVPDFANVWKDAKALRKA